MRPWGLPWARWVGRAPGLHHGAEAQPLGRAGRRLRGGAASAEFPGLGPPALRRGESAAAALWPWPGPAPGLHPPSRRAARVWVPGRHAGPAWPCPGPSLSRPAPGPGPAAPRTAAAPGVRACTLRAGGSRTSRVGMHSSRRPARPAAASSNGDSSGSIFPAMGGRAGGEALTEGRRGAGRPRSRGRAVGARGGARTGSVHGRPRPLAD